jgi:hypothetical protein
MGEMRNAYNILVEKYEQERLPGRARHRWEDNIRMNLKGIMWEGVAWTDVSKLVISGGLL